MTGDFALQLLAQLLWTTVLVSAPLLGLIMAVGLLISILQVITQVQEMSLTFVPKIVVVALALIAFGPWMLRKLVQYAATTIQNIPHYF
jgi:flagellar biosynthetic protein FliQ